MSCSSCGVIVDDNLLFCPQTVCRYYWMERNFKSYTYDEYFQKVIISFIPTHAHFYTL